MLDPQHGDATVPQAGDRDDQGFRFSVGQAAADLVEQEHRRLSGQRPRELQALALQQSQALRSPVRQWRQRGFVQDAQAQVISLPAATAALRGRRDQDVLEDRHPGEWSRHLVRAGDAEPAPLGRPFRGDVAAAKLQGAGVRGKRPGEDVEQRRLAGPVRAHDPDRHAGMEGEVDTAQHRQRAEALAQAGRGEDRRFQLRQPAV